MQLKGHMETVDCLICGDKEGSLTEIMHWKDDALHFVICPKCGLKYMKRRPTTGWYAKFYQEEFWQQSRRIKRKLPNAQIEIEELVWEEADKGTDYEMSPVEDQRSVAAGHAQRVWNIVNPEAKLSKESVVLDVGSSFGEIAHLIKEKTNCHVYSVEPSELGRSYIEKYDIPLIARTIEDLEEAKDFFGKVDLLTIGYVLENTNNPLQNLKNIRRLLSPGGKIFIDTSNIYYNNAINPYHPYIFSPETLSTMLSFAGFNIVYQEAEGHPMEIKNIESIEKAIYVATLASPGEIKGNWTPPLYPIKEAQAKGLAMVEEKRKTKL